jgi:hypothetical protein
MAMHIGESTGDAVIVEAEFLMIESEQMKCCRMEIIRVTGIFCGLKAKFVRAAVGGTSSDASPSEPGSERAGVVISSFALAGWLASEFRGADD